MTKSQPKVEERSLALVDEARDVIVVDQKSMDKANDVLIAIKGLRKEVVDTFDPIISKAHKTHEEALTQKKKVDAPLMAAEKMLKGCIADYVDKQNAKRLEEERVAQEMIDAGLGDLAIREHVPEVKMTGGYTKKRWHAEVVDKVKLIKAVANGQVSTEAITINMTYLNSHATADKDTFNIPGVKAVRETSVVSKSK